MFIKYIILFTNVLLFNRFYVKNNVSNLELLYVKRNYWPILVKFYIHLASLSIFKVSKSDYNHDYFYTLASKEILIFVKCLA